MSLLPSTYRQLCDELRSEGKGRPMPEFAEHCKKTYGFSKSRVKTMLHFSKLCDMCRAALLPIPSTPENVAPLLALPQKRWLEVWELIISFPPPWNAEHCKGVMERFGIYANRRLPDKVLKGRKVRRAAKTLAELGDGERTVEELGAKALGSHWDKAMEVAIDMDQTARNGRP